MRCWTNEERLHHENWGRDHPWNSVGSHPLNPGALSGRKHRIYLGCCFLFFRPMVLGAERIASGDVGFDDVWPSGQSLESIFPVSCLKILAKFLRVSI